MPPLPIPGIVRVTSIKILGVTLTNELSASNHIRLIAPKLSTLCEFCEVVACQVTPYKQSTEPRLSLSCFTHAVHGAASLQPVIGNELTRFSASASVVASVHRTYHPSTI